MNPTRASLGQVERRPRIVAALACANLLVMAHCPVLCLAETPKSNIHQVTPRPPRDEADLRRWLENMVWHHGYTAAEITAATGLGASEVEAALKRLAIKPEGRPARPPGAPLLVLPYPGGRHPRIGAVESEIDPQRETKVSVFTPWDARSYVVVDVPEAIWWNNKGGRELLYLAHVDIPTTWEKQQIKLLPLEWQTLADGSLRIERQLPNKVVFGTHIRPEKDAVRMELWLTNGTDQKLTGLVVQNCIMLKAAEGFNTQTNANKLLRPPYIACRNGESNRWIITAWEPCFRTWGNRPCPCMHSDPRFPDCEPGKTVRLRGWLSFYEGTKIDQELARIEATKWRANP